MNFHALCFVDMPFGQKPDLKSGVIVDFDQIYNEDDQTSYLNDRAHQRDRRKEHNSGSQ